MTGRKPKLSELQHQRLLKDYESGEYSVADLTDIYGLSRSAVYAALARVRERRDAEPHRSHTTG
jgi:transposase-like protein